MIGLGIVIIWIVVAICAGIVAGKKNRSGGGWALACFLLSPLVILILLALDPLKKAESEPVKLPVEKKCPTCEKPLSEGDTSCTVCGTKVYSPTKQCPYCAETIKAEAVVCRYCQKELVAEVQKNSGPSW